MKKISLIFLILCLLAQCAGVGAFAAAVPEDTTTPPETTAGALAPSPQGDGTSHTLDAQSPLGGQAQKLETARAALLYELNTGTMLYFWNPDARVHPASLVKAVTAMIAVEEGDLSETVTITADMLAVLRESQLYTDLQEGEQVTLGDLVYNTMVTSNNASAVLIAEHMCGTESAFVKKMNQRAKELGCTSTNFVNTHGIPHDRMYTTARDMAKLIGHAIENETFRQIFGAANYTIPATNMSEERNLKTTNYFLSKQVVEKFYDDRVTGGKSGAAATDDRSVVFTAESGGVKLLGVVMGAEGKTASDGVTLIRHGSFEEAAELLKFGFDNYMTAQVLFEDKSMTQFQVQGGANDVAVRPGATVFSALPAGTTAEGLRWEYVLDGELTAPVKAGEKIGKVQVWAGSIRVAEADMITMNGSAVSGTAGVQPDPDNAGGSGSELSTLLMVLGIVAGAVLVILLAVVLIGRIRTAALRARRRKRRESRRRSR